MRQLDEIGTLTEDEKGMLREVKRAILQHAGEAEVILYGSAARGEREPESDYDVLVLLGDQPSRSEEDEIFDAVYDVQLEYGVVVSSVVYGREQWQSPLRAATPYHASIEREGVAV